MHTLILTLLPQFAHCWYILIQYIFPPSIRFSYYTQLTSNPFTLCLSSSLDCNRYMFLSLLVLDCALVLLWGSFLQHWRLFLILTAIHLLNLWFDLNFHHLSSRISLDFELSSLVWFWSFIFFVAFILCLHPNISTMLLSIVILNFSNIRHHSLVWPTIWKPMVICIRVNKELDFEYAYFDNL